MIGVPKLILTSNEMISSKGDIIRRPGIVRIKSRRRLEVGIGEALSAGSIKRILPDVVCSKNQGILA
jgi:hypothetical protein